MKNRLATALVLIALLVMVEGLVSIRGTQASNTLVVPDQFSTISAAVQAASPGDTVFVKNGVYNENVLINKPLALIGQNTTDTIIVGSGGTKPAAVLTLESNDVKVSGLTLESLNYSTSTMYAYGIWVEGDNCTITGNVISNTYTGIFCSTQAHTTVTQNTVKGSLKNGICFYGGAENEISDNQVIKSAVSGIEIDGYSDIIANNDLLGNFRAIGLGASNSVVFGNDIHSNSESGIFLAGSYNIISANTLSLNKYGVFVTTQLTAPSNDRLYNNNFEGNFINAFDNSSALIEVWDDGAKPGGNYWSDYQTRYPSAAQVASSGVWNTPYSINSNNTDNYPLVSPFDTSNLVTMPPAISPLTAKPDSIVAFWKFNTVEPSLVTPDETGANPAILGSETPVYNNTPPLVPGKFGDALNFTGNVFCTVPPSPSILTPNDVTIDAWINIQAIKPGVVYQNIFIEAISTMAKLPTRTLGLAVNGQQPENASSPPICALRGYVVTANGLNEIDTTSALPYNTWVHVVFTRSTTTGMHIYVNGVEQNVTVAAGTADPTGPIQNPTAIYIGHDSKMEIEDLKIGNFAYGQTQPLWTQWWLWIIILTAALVGALVFYRRRFIHRLRAELY